MKAMLITALLVAVAASAMAGADPAAPATPKTKWTLVKVVDRDGKDSFQVLDGPALTALQAEIKSEERLYDKAMMLTEKAWKADTSTKTKIFPRSAIGHRSCEPTGSGNPYSKREEADKAMSAAEDRIVQAEKAAEESKKRKEESMRQAGGNNNTGYVPKRKDNKQAEIEKKVLDDQARMIFASKLTELKTPKADAKAKEEPAAGAGAAAEAKPDVKAAGAAGLAGVGGMKK